LSVVRELHLLALEPAGGEGGGLVAEVLDGLAGIDGLGGVDADQSHLGLQAELLTKGRPRVSGARPGAARRRGMRPSV